MVASRGQFVAVKITRDKLRAIGKAFGCHPLARHGNNVFEVEEHCPQPGMVLKEGDRIGAGSRPDVDQLSKTSEVEGPGDFLERVRPITCMAPMKARLS